MSVTRRDLIKAMGVAGAAAAIGPTDVLGARAIPQARRSLRILFIGGTGFIGPHMVRRALARGHTVTLFNRGRTNPHLFPDVEKLRGDRDGGLGVLRGRAWDAVIDTSGYIPRLVRDSAELLRDNVHRYLFISTGDAYADFIKIGIDEDYTLDTIDDPTNEEPSKHYGPLKVLCEKVVLDTYPDRNTILRPGWIIGAGDYNSISPYWPMRVHRGGEVLAPGDPTHRCSRGPFCYSESPSIQYSPAPFFCTPPVPRSAILYSSAPTTTPNSVLPPGRMPFLLSTSLTWSGRAFPPSSLRAARTCDAKLWLFWLLVWLFDVSPEEEASGSEPAFWPNNARIACIFSFAAMRNVLS
ncbi:MAG: twin-arginine translocation signal domain-containing protein, partial [Gemmatimonadetes bacterium]|nr:twin-arginine translocation signal domain-containing protein [Gemmatimonadota bacterium]